ncbi:uncharacterized protein isoform X2 [Macaca fascicularis]|uniref:uncharacterized protein isoform X2 n=1 Tax=Macaca fascicularis TaxID=9541 RepID=UPI003D15CC8F
MCNGQLKPGSQYRAPGQCLPRSSAPAGSGGPHGWLCPHHLCCAGPAVLEAGEGAEGREESVFPRADSLQPAVDPLAHPYPQLQAELGGQECSRAPGSLFGIRGAEGGGQGAAHTGGWAGGANTTKNRYPHVLPYDHCRVRLTWLEGEPHSDYINPNFIPGYTHAPTGIHCPSGASQENAGGRLAASVGAAGPRRRRADCRHEEREDECALQSPGKATRWRTFSLREWSHWHLPTGKAGQTGVRPIRPGGWWNHLPLRPRMGSSLGWGGSGRNQVLCERYWPAESTLVICGHITIHLLAKEPEDEWTKREFQLQHMRALRMSGLPSTSSRG